MTALVILKRDAIHCYYSDRDTPVSVSVPSSAMTDMEIINEEELTAALSKALGAKSSHPITQTILVISDELCFYEQSPIQEEESTVKKLSGGVPLARVATTVIRSPDKALVIATNSDVYEAIVYMLTQQGYPVALVIPWAAIAQAGISSHGEIDKATVRRVFDARSTLKAMSFSLGKPRAPEVVVKNKEKQEPKKKTPIGWIVFIGVAVLYAVGMLVFMVLR